MLVSFEVENFRSIHFRTSITTEVNSSVSEYPENTHPSGVENIPNLVKSIAIYGKNAAGKSNLLLAIQAMRKFIVNCHKLTAGDKIPVDPFLLANNTQNAPSTFVIEFIVDGVRYEYGYSIDQNIVHHEFLNAYPKLSKQVWFERTLFNENEYEYDWKFSPNFKGEKESIRTRTLYNTLFFSKAAQENHEMILPLMHFFRNTLLFAFDTDARTHTYDFIKNEDGRQLVNDFITNADLGIEDLFVKEKQIDMDLLRDFFDEEELNKKFSKSTPTELIPKSMHHVPGENKKIQFDFRQQESVGSQEVFKLAGLIFKTLECGGVLFIDEIENNLHCSVLDFLIYHFHDRDINPKGAQLIFTTHNPIILETTDFRRDQVWFAQKTDEKNTLYYDLSRLKKNNSEYKPVRKGQNLLKAFLDGKFYSPPEPNLDDLKSSYRARQFPQLSLPFDE